MIDLDPIPRCELVRSTQLWHRSAIETLFRELLFERVHIIHTDFEQFEGSDRRSLFFNPKISFLERDVPKRESLEFENAVNPRMQRCPNLSGYGGPPGENRQEPVSWSRLSRDSSQIVRCARSALICGRYEGAQVDQPPAEEKRYEKKPTRESNQAIRPRTSGLVGGSLPVARAWAGQPFGSRPV